jgi:flagellar protein FlbT
MLPVFLIHLAPEENNRKILDCISNYKDYAMALKITLKPSERMVIGGAVIANGDSRSQFTIENRVPVLREPDIMSEEHADSPARLIYFVIQLMYIDSEHQSVYYGSYWRVAQELVQAAPFTVAFIDPISEYILSDRYYLALKMAKKLMAYEEEALNSVQ